MGREKIKLLCKTIIMKKLITIITLSFAFAMTAQVSTKTIYTENLSGLTWGGVQLNAKVSTDLSKNEKKCYLLLNFTDPFYKQSSSVIFISNEEVQNFIKDISSMRDILSDKDSDPTVLNKPNYNITLKGKGITVLELSSPLANLYSTTFNVKGVNKLIESLKKIDIDKAIIN